MPIAILFHPVSLNAATYERALARLEAVLGGPNPGGRRYHACYGTGDKLSVFEVWESMAQFEMFGAVLMPILHELGIDVGEPDIQPLQQVIVS
ncbi:MAG: hypothetical protein IPG72_09475 [Ardenticatenales bacterium]|jgi:hypothetical protein|nr:hypothetical protein [Ardenticatenales bacterium]